MQSASAARTVRPSHSGRMPVVTHSRKCSICKRAAEKTGRVFGGQKRGGHPRRDHAHERGDQAIPARHPGDRGDHARQGDQVDPTVRLWGQDPWKAHSCVFSLRRFFGLGTASHRPDSSRSCAYCARSAEELCGGYDHREKRRLPSSINHGFSLIGLSAYARKIGESRRADSNR